MVKEFDKFAVFFIFRSVYDYFIRVDRGGETASPGVGLDLGGGLPGPDRGGGGQVPGDGRRRDHLHHLPGQGQGQAAGQRQGGGAGHRGGARPQGGRGGGGHHCLAEGSITISL